MWEEAIEKCLKHSESVLAIAKIVLNLKVNGEDFHWW